jgi:hypothetical protein
MGLEIVLAVAALYGGAATVLSNRQVLAESGRNSPEKLRALWHLVLADAILAIMAVAAWAVYVETSWARWMSIAAGAALICALAARPSLAGGRRWVASTLALLAIGVVALAVVLPSGG